MATYDFTDEDVIVQGARLQRTFHYLVDDVAQSLAGYSFRAQVRQHERSDALLLLDLTPYLTVREDDDTALDLDVPSDVTAALVSKKFKDDSAWDLFFWPTAEPEHAELLLQGAAAIDPSATDMRSTS